MNQHRMRMDAYWSPDHFRSEVDAILDQRWIVLGRSDSIPAPGYRTFDIGRHRVVVTRDDDNRLSAFSRICLHRWMELCEGAGAARKLVCPYHGWQYDLRGALTATPQMTLSHRGKALWSYKVTERHGLLFLTLKASQERLEELSEALCHSVLCDQHLARHAYLGSTHFGSFPFNWKIALENAECNHHDYVHKISLGRDFPARNSTGRPLGRDCYGLVNFSADATTIDSDAIETLFAGPPDRHRNDCFVLIFIFPFTFIYVSTTVSLVYNMLPAAANETAVYCDFFGTDTTGIVDLERRSFVQTLVQEDSVVCARIQKMIDGNFGDPAMLTPEEPMNIAFRQWYLALEF